MNSEKNSNKRRLRDVNLGADLSDNDTEYCTPDTIDSSSSDELEDGEEIVKDRKLHTLMEADNTGQNGSSSVKTHQDKYSKYSQLSKKPIVEEMNDLRDSPGAKLKTGFRKFDNDLVFDCIVKYCKTTDSKEWTFPVYKENSKTTPCKIKAAFMERLNKTQLATEYLVYINKPCFRPLVCSLMLKITESLGNLEKLEQKLLTDLRKHARKHQPQSNFLRVLWSGPLVLSLKSSSSKKVFLKDPDSESPATYDPCSHILLECKAEKKNLARLQATNKKFGSEYAKKIQEAESLKKQWDISMEAEKNLKENVDKNRKTVGALNLLKKIFKEPVGMEFALDVFVPDDKSTGALVSDGDILQYAKEVVSTAEKILNNLDDPHPQ